MSGWIRVKELPTRYEVRSPYADEALLSRTEAKRKLEEARLLTPSLPVKFLTVRRWQAKRTEVTEERNSQRTWFAKPRYLAPLVVSVFIGESKQTGRKTAWYVELYVSGELPTPCSFGSRKEAETAARKWLDANGYRVRKVAT